MTAGRPFPLGARLDARGANFAVFSAHAEKVELCFFDPLGRHEIERLALPEYTDGVWHGFLPEARPGLLYGYRVHGPYEPAAGHRFNHHKLLLDPYARDIVGLFHLSDAHFGYRIGSHRGDLTPDRRDNARVMPKCRLVDESFSWGEDRPPRTPWRDTVICELHVGGYTRTHPEVESTLRGSVAGLRAPAVIAHLKRLGITAVELLPVHAAVDDRALAERGLRNYWGYNTIGYFAPDRRLLGRGGVNEFKRTVAALHAADIEVLLDVVYNHTAEGNHLGPTLCFRGIDNASYYWLTPEDRRHYLDFTGCGNSLQLAHPRVLQMVLDSLRYWVEVMHVDGFRFDLATTLGRGPNGFDAASAFLDAVLQDPVLAQVKLIAEPWDLGLGGYQVGKFPAGWSEWNDRYRDTLRRFWRGDGGLVGEMASRLTGSADIFRHCGRRPTASVNFITAHDGFTLSDLVSYNEKHNEANHEENRDGTPENLSWNGGAEGPTDDPSVLDLRCRQRRNLLASLLLSQGVPMLLGGDEVANSQNGNNNAYCQDNEIGWVDWSKLGVEGQDLTGFVAAMVEIRRSCGLARDRFFDGATVASNGLKDTTWLRLDGAEMTEEDWAYPNARFLAYAVNGSVSPVMIVLNGHHEMLPFVVPTIGDTSRWRTLVDTSMPADDAGAERKAGETFEVPARSLTVLAGSPG
jgi:glycogen operon protein